MRLRANPAQLYYLRKRTRRNIIIKPRQKGISKWIDGDQLVDCMRRFTNAVVISHQREATVRLMDGVKNFIDSLDIKPFISVESKSELKFPKRGSTYFIGTAGQKAFGRGDTVHRAHLSEAAFYQDFETILGGIGEAAEYGQIDIETTANGREQVYDMYQKAKAGNSSYTAIFIPWFIDQEYSVENMTPEERAGLSAGVQQMFNIPDAEFLANLQPDERDVVARAITDWGITLTAGQLKWRRYKIWDKGILFFQEYPEDDVSCFLQTGRSVFSQIICKPELQVPLDNFANWGATDEVKQALKKRRLFGGMDCAEGTATGDANCFVVIDINPLTSKGVVIFELTSNEPPDVFDLKVKKICDRFDILLGVEKNGVGLAHCNKFEGWGTRFEPWDTTAASRPVMITDLEEAYRKGDLVESYPEAENEARDMQYGENNRADTKKGKHDDRVFARAIAWQMRKMPVAGVTFL